MANRNSETERKASNLIAQYSKQCVYEFCDVTSIHGFKQFLGRNKLLIEKIWWVSLFVISLYYCVDLMYSVYDKWHREPIIISFDQQPSRIYTIPFPAVTICPETKVKASELNVSQTFDLVRKNQLNESMDEQRVRKLLTLLQLCDYNIYDRQETPHYEDDVLLLLRRMSIPSFEMFNVCSWKSQNTRCLDLFKTSLTDKGFCYTFNTVANNDILRIDQLDPRYALNSETQQSDWTIDTGFRPGSTSNAFPRRVLAGGYSNSLEVTLIANKSDLDYLCGDSFQGFKVLLHMPNEYPHVTNQYFRVPLDQELIVTITPRVEITSDRARLYQPEKRKCFYANERYLRFFKIYTKKNCELECLTNHTLNLCGCVKFSMPRPVGVAVCTLHDSPCYQTAIAHAVREDSKTNCNCMPTCNYVEYHTQVSQAQWKWQIDGDFNYLQRQLMGDEYADCSVHQSKVVIYFRESDFIPLRRSEMNGVSNMIASCGGLMGLFMGVSLVSLVELVYYCTVRPVAMWKLAKRKKNEAAQKGKTCNCESETNFDASEIK